MRRIIRAFPVVLALVAFACRQEPAPESAAAVASVTSKDGTRIAFEKTGNGPALIIVDGALAHRKLYSDTALRRLLAQHFTVISYDRRGRGESADVQPYSVDREIEDIEALINTSGGQAYLYGIASGAALAMRAAVTLGAAKVRKLALFEPPYGHAPGDFEQQKQRLAEVIKSGKPGAAAEFFLAANGYAPEAVDDLKSSPDWDAVKRVDFTLAYDLEVLGNGSVPADIARTVAVPTLVMDDDKSMEFLHATADTLVMLIPGAHRKTVMDQVTSAPAEAIAPMLVEFLTATAPSGGA